jgi:tRNA-dihydrouridine synthase B
MNLMLEFYDTQTAINLAKKHISWYTKGLECSAEFRSKINSMETANNLWTNLKEFFNTVQ